MNDFKLTEHFTLCELTRTDKMELQELNRRKALCYTGQLRQLCADLLEPVRAHYGKPVIIHSGYRCYELNKSVGGNINSQHMLGQAADFHIDGASMDDAFSWLWKESGLKFGQLIDEHRGGSRWLHISAGTKCEVLGFKDGKYEKLA